jgi:hypothetical protein
VVVVVLPRVLVASGMNSAEFEFTNKNESKNEPENDHF